LTGIWTVESPMLKEPVVAVMEAPFLKQGFVNVMATLTFSDSTIRAFDSRLGFIWACDESKPLLNRRHSRLACATRVLACSLDRSMISNSDEL